jgi:hypothetical protein
LYVSLKSRLTSPFSSFSSLTKGSKKEHSHPRERRFIFRSLFDEDLVKQETEVSVLRSTVILQLQSDVMLQKDTMDPFILGSTMCV